MTQSISYRRTRVAQTPAPQAWPLLRGGTRGDTRPRPLRPSLQPGWPLTWLFMLFPLWWILGVSHFVFLLAAIPMLAELLRRRPVLAPIGFAAWLLFMVVVGAGATLLWLEPPGTVPVDGISRLVIFGYRYAWYAAVTIVALYVLNMPERELSTDRVMKLVSWMFVYTTCGGLAGLIFSDAEIPSLLELVIPLQMDRDGFFYSLIHPSLTTTSDFLGYDQPRPSAPFAYANAWGNNLGLFMPFFVYTWLRKGAGWRRPVGVVILGAAVIPIAFSLNRGLWAGLVTAALITAVKFAQTGRFRAVQATVALIVIGGIAFAASPLYDTVSLRVNTPHSNDRRGNLATEVVGGTLSSSALLGYGDTRSVKGSFASIAGGETPDCEHCAEPALGTQGFVWRLIYTTGLLGTLLFLAFVCMQLWRFVGARDPVAIVGSLVIVLTLLFSFVYDSLESPLFTMMIAVGLMNRRFARPGQLAGDIKDMPHYDGLPS